MVFEKSESESESSDDDNIELLREAADPDFINDKMFRLAGKKSEESWTYSKPATTEKAEKSQRYVADESAHIDDLLIPEEVQKFVSKKLTKIIEDRVEFVEIPNFEVDNRQIEVLPEQIKLLDDVLLQIDWADNKRYSQRKKPEIKKRRLSDVDNSKTEMMKVREAVVDPEDIVKEVINWKPKTKGTVFEYLEKNGRYFEVEQGNEFSDKRKKNNWDESKISRNKKR